MSSPSVNRIHHSPRPTSSTHGFDDDEGEDAGARISISDPHPASRPSTPPSPSYSFVISSSPLSPTDMVNTIEDGMRREGDMV